MPSIRRVADVSTNTVTKLLEEADQACLAIHDETVRNVRASCIRCDEIWSFCHAEQKNVETAKAALQGAGDIWTWTAIDANTKLIVSYHVDSRSGENAIVVMGDPRTRLANQVQITTDGRRAYVEAEGAFGIDVDYGQRVKLYGPTASAPGCYNLPEGTGIKNTSRGQSGYRTRLDQLFLSSART